MPIPIYASRVLATLTSFFVLAGAGFAQGPKISFASAGGPAKRVLAELSAKTGLPLATNAQTESDFLVIQVRGVSSERLLQEIAWSVWGSWKKEGNRLVLVRTDSDRTEAENTARKLEAEAFQSGIDARRQKVVEQGEFTEEKATELAVKFAAIVKNFDPSHTDDGFYTRVNRLTRQSPIQRAMNRLVAQFSARELAELPFDVPVVFSNRPTRMQRAFGATANSITATFQREESYWHEAARRANLQHPQIGDTTYGISGLPNFDAEIDADRLVLVVTKSGYLRGSATLQLFATNRRGEVLAQATDSLISTDFEDFMDGSVGGNEIHMSRPDQEWVRAISKGKSLSPEMFNQLLDPERFDPVALMASPILQGYARAKNTNLVAGLSDQAVSLGMIPGEKITTRMVEKLLGVMAQTKSSDGLVCWRPNDLKRSRESRADRKVLGEFLRRNANLKPFSLDERASWAFRLPLEDSVSQLPSSLASLARRSVGNEMDVQFSGKILKLYGSMNPDQRRALREEGLLGQALTPVQGQLLFDLTYGLNPNLRVKHSSSQHGGFAFSSEVARLATETLPDGISPLARITLKDESEEVAFVTGTRKGTALSPSPMTAQTVALTRCAENRPDLYPWLHDMKFDFSKVQFGRTHRYLISVSYNDSVSQEFNLEDREYTTGKSVSLSQAPPTFLRAYQEALKLYEQMMKTDPGVDLTNHGAPPPPPRR